MLFFKDSTTMNEKVKSCKHDLINKFGTFQNCQKCGLYIPQDKEIKCYKTSSLDSECYIDTPRHYKSLCCSDFSSLNCNSTNFCDQYLKQREELILLITEIGQKLNFQLSTMHLAVQYMDIINSRIQFPEPALKVYAVTCSMLAGLFLLFLLISLAKAIELDERIPFISKLRKNSSLTYRASDIKKAERHIISLLEWKLQISTIYELLQNYLCIGILFSNDKIMVDKEPSFLKSIENQFQTLKLSEKKDQKQTMDGTTAKLLKDIKQSEIEEISKKICKETMRLTNMIVRDISFISIEKKTLALACVCFLRKIVGIQNYWNNELEVLSFGLKQSEINPCFQILANKFESLFHPIENTTNCQIARSSPSSKLSSKVFNQIRLNNMPNSQHSQQNQYFPQNMSMMSENIFYEGMDTKKVPQHISFQK